MRKMSSPRAQSIAAPAGIQMAAVSGNPAAKNVIIGNPASTEPIHQLKHPSCHLLENTNREAYLNLCMPLYKAAIKGDWDTVKGILNVNPALLTASLTQGWETVLHVAAGAKNNIHFVEELVKMMDEEDLALQDIKGNTALSFAAASGNVEIAEILIHKNRSLPTIPCGQGMTPLYVAALFGQSKMAWYLYPKTYEMLDEKSRRFLFFCCIDHDLYDLAMKLLQDDTTLATARKGNRDTALHVLARKSSEFGDQCTSGMCSALTNTFLGSEVSYERNLKQTEALKLVECLWKEMLKHEDDEVTRLLREPSELLFDAAKLGNYEFLSVLIDSYPELILEIDNNNRTIFHIAVLHRHANIFNLVHETGSIKDIIATFTDDESNNILHLAAKLAPQDQLNLVSGAALQMQRELVWFKEVEKIVRPPFLDMKNKQGKTPRELFTNEHEDLLRKGESWMKDTASSCILVSTLIATVVFAAAFSSPGGIRTYDDDKGTPNFVKETAFRIFYIIDGVVLFSSSTAILMFLYILTSRHAEHDFLISLPLTLMIGITSLFVSITSMMVDFSTAFYISCHYGLRWVPDLLFRFAIVTVALFAFLQYHLLSDMFFSTYCSYLLFQPRRDMIYRRDKKYVERSN